MFSNLKRLTAFAVLAIAAQLTLIPTTAQTAGPYYTMKCRGGGSMTARLKHQGEHVRLEIRFRRADQPYHIRAPEWGACTWIDRRISSREPTHFFIQTQRYYHRTEVLCRRNRCIVAVAPHTFARIIEAVRNGRTFTLKARNRGNGWFQAALLSTP